MISLTSFSTVWHTMKCMFFSSFYLLLIPRIFLSPSRRKSSGNKRNKRWQPKKKKVNSKKVHQKTVVGIANIPNEYTFEEMYMESQKYRYSSKSMIDGCFSRQATRSMGDVVKSICKAGLKKHGNMITIKGLWLNNAQEFKASRKS